MTYFVCDSASELERWALLSMVLLLGGFPLELVFLKLFLGNCYFVRKCWDFLWVFILFYFSVPYLELACAHE